MKNFSQIIKGTIAGLLVVASLGMASAGTYVGPTSAPTGGNAEAPINVGTAAQTKNGALQVTAFSALGNSYFATSVGINETAADNGLKLDVNGNIGAQKYCDQDGLNCSNIAGITMPSGAVMAFNLDACPTGWTAFAAAAGRNIIGVGNSGEPGATYHARGAVGGKETHTLTIAQMPLHNHNIVLSRSRDAASGSADTNVDGIYAGGNTTSATEYVGGGQAHGVMDPYVTLLYCSKN